MKNCRTGRRRGLSVVKERGASTKSPDRRTSGTRSRSIWCHQRQGLCRMSLRPLRLRHLRNGSTEYWWKSTEYGWRSPPGQRQRPSRISGLENCGGCVCRVVSWAGKLRRMRKHDGQSHPMQRTNSARPPEILLCIVLRCLALVSCDDTVKVAGPVASRSRNREGSVCGDRGISRIICSGVVCLDDSGHFMPPVRHNGMWQIFQENNERWRCRA